MGMIRTQGQSLKTIDLNLTQMYVQRILQMKDYQVNVNDGSKIIKTQTEKNNKKNQNQPISNHKNSVQKDQKQIKIINKFDKIVNKIKVNEKIKQPELDKILKNKQKYVKNYFKSIKKHQIEINNDKIKHNEYHLPQIMLGKWRVNGFIIADHLILKGQKMIKKSLNKSRLKSSASYQNLKSKSAENQKQTLIKKILSRQKSRKAKLAINKSNYDLNKQQQVKKQFKNKPTNAQTHQQEKLNKFLIEKAIDIEEKPSKLSKLKTQQQKDNLKDIELNQQIEVTFLVKKYQYSKVYKKVKQNYYQFVYDRFQFEK